MTTVEAARDRLGTGTRRLPVRYVPVLVTLSLVVAMFTAGSLHYPYFGTGQVFLNLFVDNSFLLVAVVEEDAADAARLATVRDEEILVAPLLECGEER